ncbi:MAG: hypothetical protein EWM72_01319 [Nitrospira sp.]|nr:MAG: hypothetical protein EWM72_01319 [Nitrospira sp.]
MPFTLRPYRRFSVQCAVTNNAGPFLTLPPACIFGFWFLITLLVLNRGPVYAEWVEIEKEYQSPGLQTVYIDSATIRREENLVAMVILIDWTWMQGNGRGAHRFRSTKTHKQFDCAEKRLRLLAFTEFSRPMGTGRPAGGYVDIDTWLPVEPESLNQALWEVACGKP